MSDHLEKALMLCKKAGVEIRGSPSDIKPIIDACESSRRELFKKMGKTICTRASRTNAIQIDTDRMQELVDEIMKRARTIDKIIKLLQIVNNEVKSKRPKPIDIRSFLTHSAEDECDSIIIEQFGK